MQVGFWKDMKREGEEDEAAHAALGAELAREYPDHLPLLAARVASLAALQGDKRKARLQARLCAVCGLFSGLQAVQEGTAQLNSWKPEVQCDCMLTCYPSLQTLCLTPHMLASCRSCWRPQTR